MYGAREEMATFQAYLNDVVVSVETLKQLYAQEEVKTFHNGQDRDVKQVVERKSLLSRGIQSPLLKKKLQNIKPFTKPLELNRSFINIMTGCNKYCAYCIVPFTRGREVSYSINEIIDRVEHDVKNGAKEVTLIGQNVNSYIDPVSGNDFSELLRQVVKVDGEFWVRWVSPHPQDMTVELFDVIAQHRDKIPPYVHFPVQSGSNRVLELMKRNYTVEKYLEQIGWLRSRMPDAVISTDMIVGFPGETEQDYLQTRELMETVQYDFMFSFIYSPRKYTKAWKMEDDCPKEIKAERLETLQKRQIEICLEKNLMHIDKIVKTLVEKRLTNGKLLARTEGNLRVLFDGKDSLIGDFVNLKIEQAGPANLFATLCE